VATQRSLGLRDLRNASRGQSAISIEGAPDAAFLVAAHAPTDRTLKCPLCDESDAYKRFELMSQHSQRSNTFGRLPDKKFLFGLPHARCYIHEKSRQDLVRSKCAKC
jgi:hypothetical protein